MRTYEESHLVGEEWVDPVFGPVRRIPKPTPWQIPRGNWFMKKEDQEAARRALGEVLRARERPDKALGADSAYSGAAEMIANDDQGNNGDHGNNLDSTRIVHSALGPLPEDFFILEDARNVQNSQPDHSIRKRKLSARLAEAHNLWHCTKDDQEGWEQRRKAYQMALDAFLEWAYAEDIPAEHLQLLVDLTSILEDLNSGKRPKLATPALRPKLGRPPLTTGRAARLATMCAAVDILSRNQPQKLIGDIEKEVAHAADIGVGALRSRRKKFNAGQDARDRALYDKIMRICEQQADPREAVINLLKKTIWRGH
jgi:hypothetical protein